MKLKLTDLTIRSLPVPAKGQQEYYDLNYPGLCIRISQGGSKVFTFKNRQNGAARRITLGKYPDLTLAAARAACRQISAVPGQSSLAFGEAVQAYLSVATVQMSKSHSREVARILTTTFQSMHALTLTTVTTKHVTDIIDALTKTTPGQALHVHNRIKTFFRWCRMRNLLTVNPVEFLPAPSKYIPRDRILTFDELRRIWHACPQLGIFGKIVQCLVLTGCRRNEVAQMRREWIQGDDLLVIPKEYTKSKKEHVLPLTALSMSIIQTHAAAPNLSAFVFPAQGTQTAFSAWSKSKRKLDILSSVSAWTLHDLRRSYRTNLVAWKCCNSEIAELLIGHSLGSALFRTYDRYDRLEEKRDAVAKYERHLKAVLNLPT
jgi:integrase